MFWPLKYRKLEMEPHTSSASCMGTEVHQRIYGLNGALVAKRALLELQRLDSLWSPFKKGSTVSTINQAAGRRRVQVDSSTLQILIEAKRWGHLSKGTFDSTIYPVLELWRKAAQKRTLPDAEEIERRLPLVNIEDLQISPHGEIYLPLQGQGLDLGGIGKGYAADRVREIYEEAGIQHALINIGGNVLVINSTFHGSPWKIGIKSPSSPQGSLLGYVEAVNCSVVTSGDYEQFFEYRDPVLGRRTFHHIIDPQTGWPAESHLSGVTVMSPSSIQADVLATALFILGVEEGLTLCTSFQDTYALIVDKNGSLHMSEGMEDFFFSMREE